MNAPSGQPLPVAGIAYAVLAMTCFAVIDTTHKLLSASVPLFLDSGLGAAWLSHREHPNL